MATKHYADLARDLETYVNHFSWQWRPQGLRAFLRVCGLLFL